MDSDAAADLYRGDKGREYHAQRAGGRSTRSQMVRRSYFEDLSGPGDVLLDFGCATGEVVSGLPAKQRWGVEINELAAGEARERLDRVAASLSEIADASVDRLISFHAIEHVADPIGLFAEFRRVLRAGGTARVIVPYESVFLNAAHRSWRPGDSDMHLFAWTPLTFGNALFSAGLDVRQVRVTHWAGPGRLGSLLAPFGLRRAARWINALRRGRLQIVADFVRS
ncbi:MAG: class I SAM-dependent methyltransferase [Pseudomonadota bacterium]